MISHHQLLKVLLGSLLAGTMLASQAVNLSQTPLLTQSGSVKPNLFLIMDTSGSMDSQFLYQYGGTPDGYGYPGPGDEVSNGWGQTHSNCPKDSSNVSTTNIDTPCTYVTPTLATKTISAATTPAAWEAKSYSKNALVTYGSSVWKCNRDSGCTSTNVPGISSRWTKVPPALPPGDYSSAFELSPDVNRLTYDPRVTYKVRLTSTIATPTAKADIATYASSDFRVYFYKNAAGNPAIWGGTASEPHPALASSFFTPSYTPAGTPVLAAGATSLSYPNCVGTGLGCTSPTLFPKFANRSDCVAAATSCSSTEEKQNYANWKKFHSNRLDLAKTGLSYAFENVAGSLRLGWGQVDQLGTNTSASTTLGTNGSGIGALDQARKNAFYTWLYSRGADNATYLRNALIAVGEYFKRSDNKGPWADDQWLDPTSKGTASLTVSTSTAAGADNAANRLAHASCRRSYAMMMTDGYYNDDAPGGSTPVDTDYTAISEITGVKPDGTPRVFNYNGRTAPYAQQSTYTTLADIAMKYWITDLRPVTTTSNYGLINNVPTSVSNESFWQNMGFYGVTLGVTGTLDQSLAPPTTWPEGDSGGDDQYTVDDMWHATKNGRGSVLNARSADALADGVEAMLSTINKVESSQSGVAASALSLNTGTKKYTPYYVTGSWFGNVIASNLDGASGADLCTKWRVAGSWLDDPTSTTTPKAKHWYVGGRPDGTVDLAPCAGSPSTFNGIAAEGSRTIYSWNGTGMGNFDSTNTFVTSAATGVASGSGVAASTDLVKFLRGDTSKEDVVDASGVVTTTNLYRARQYVLGDIVNSTPTFIQGALDMSYEKLPAGTYGQAGYRAFIATKAARAEGVLFAGANDGMLHGFRDTTGVEVFAFVPRAVIPNMYKLANRSYDHQYFVDGTTMEADACLTGGSACTTWTNLLLGTTGAGAKEVFALDVTTPTSMAATSVKWEITPATTGFENLGNVLSDIQTGLTIGGQWVAIFGNGYTGADGRAHLYVANLDTGAWIADIPVGSAGTATSPGNNGLGGVGLLRDDNQRIIAAYAGDLNGNLWKFNLSSTSSTGWFAGLNGVSSSPPVPLYKTLLTPVKPITAAPTVVKHPTNGYVVAFGTGKLFESSTTDIGNTDVQSVIGVWDSVTPPAATQVDTTTMMVQQTISGAIVGTNVVTNADMTTTTVATNYYSVSKNPITWTTNGTTNSRGWYINLPNTGQRTIYPLSTLVGSYVAVDTVSPSNVSTNACLVSGSGKAWNYIIDMVTGSGPTEAIFKDNGGIDAATIVTGYENLADGRTRYIKNDVLSTLGKPWFTPLSGGGQGPGFGISCKLTNTCNNVPSVKRTWRQLYMR